MQKYWVLSICIATMMFPSCWNVTIENPISPEPVVSVDSITNIPWKLTSAALGNRILDLSTFKSFQFFIEDSTIYGYDGCNWYSGESEIDNDSIRVWGIGRTEMGCSGRPEFDARLLKKQWAMFLTSSTITLIRHDTVLVFYSQFAKPISGYSFVNKRWKLHASNDPAFVTLQSFDLLPQLDLTEGRDFDIRWYFAPRNPGFECNLEGGAFGIGANQTIYFFTRRFAYTCPDSLQSPSDSYLVQRLIGSTHFSFSDSTFTLRRLFDNMYYEFAPESSTVTNL